MREEKGTENIPVQCNSKERAKKRARNQTERVQREDREYLFPESSVCCVVGGRQWVRKGHVGERGEGNREMGKSSETKSNTYSDGDKEGSNKGRGGRSSLLH